MNKNKAIIFAIIGVLLASSLALAAEFAVAMPTISADTMSNRLLSASWVRINCVITQWGTTDVRGQLQTQARTTIHQSSDTNQINGASAIWTTNLTREISAFRAKENFTYVFYVARLPNASISTITINSASDYSLTGTWNLANVTTSITVITNKDGTIAHIHRDQDIISSKAYGELTITGNQFTLKIDGISQLTGSVYRSITRAWFNPYKMTDDSTTNVVTRTDVKTIAQNYGAMPGWGNYDSRMDFNHNYRVDIADISSVARNVDCR
jgi:hypothetical protein